MNARALILPGLLALQGACSYPQSRSEAVQQCTTSKNRDYQGCVSNAPQGRYDDYGSMRREATGTRKSSP